jgi:hypothetical protein
MENYWQFIAREARLIGSDGCTKVSEWHQECCFEHDLSCHYGKDPRLAYAWYCLNSDGDYWQRAGVLSRRQADYAFARCNYQWSASKIGKVRSFFRFLGVRVGALLGIGAREPKP